MLDTEGRRARELPESRPAAMAPLEARSGDDPAESEIYGEYSSPQVSLPGWGFASILMALPGVALPWLVPALLDKGVAWSTLRPLFLAVPITALLGLVFGIVGVRREDGGTSALIGLGLNVVLILLVTTYIVVRYF